MGQDPRIIPSQGVPVGLRAADDRMSALTTAAPAHIGNCMHRLLEGGTSTMQHLARLLAGLGFCVLLLPGHRGGSLPAAHVQGEDLLVSTTGTVRLLRKGWKDFVPVSAGARLAPTDLLDVQGSATVLCTGPSLTVK